MKNLMIGVLAVLSFSAFGNSYRDIKASCSVTGNQRGINSKLKTLNTLYFDLSATEVVGRKDLLNIKVYNLQKKVKEQDYISVSRKVCRKNYKKTCFKMDNGYFIPQEKEVLKDIGYNVFEIDNLKNIHTYYNGTNVYGINFKQVDNLQLEKLITDLGGEVRETLPYGLSHASITEDRAESSYVTHQVHFPFEINDGESYHIIIDCREVEFRQKVKIDFK